MEMFVDNIDNVVMRCIFEVLDRFAKRNCLENVLVTTVDRQIILSVTVRRSSGDSLFFNLKRREQIDII